MRFTTALAILLSVWASASASAQNRIYLGGTAGANMASRGPVDVGDVVWTAGGVAGVRVSGAWSIEIEADRGFATKERVSRDHGWLRFAPPGASPDELERLTVRATFRRIDRARDGYSVHAVWTSREPGPLNVALYGGLSWRHLEQRVIRTITYVPDDPAVPEGDPNVRDSDERRTITAGGYTAGVMVPVRVREGLTVGPDFRFSLGLVTDESTYKSFTAAVRVMWGFRSPAGR